jgi:hypothetical protein
MFLNDLLLIEFKFLLTLALQLSKISLQFPEIRDLSSISQENMLKIWIFNLED